VLAASPQHKKENLLIIRIRIRIDIRIRICPILIKISFPIAVIKYI